MLLGLSHRKVSHCGWEEFLYRIALLRTYICVVYQKCYLGLALV